MSLRIQNNVEAFNAHRQLTATSSAQAKAMEKLSSGYRINRAWMQIKYAEGRTAIGHKIGLTSRAPTQR